MTLRISDVARKDFFSLMTRKGYTVPRLAMITGMSSSTIRRFLHGGTPDAFTTRRLSEVLGISAQSIYH
jgi:transcriptional regulator with XRE-family HTH domain